MSYQYQAISKLFLTSLLFILLSACSNEPRTTEVEQRLQELRERPSGRIDPVPDFSIKNMPEYTRANERDPFTPDRQLRIQPELQADTGLAPDSDRHRTQLEQWDLNELSLRGIMQRGNKIRALILTPDEELVTVNIGDYLGQNHGRITEINSQGIKLVELISDSQGSWQEREQEFNLSR